MMLSCGIRRFSASAKYLKRAKVNVFLDDKVQTPLKYLTGRNDDRIFRRRFTAVEAPKIDHNRRGLETAEDYKAIHTAPPWSYHFVTDDELGQMRAEAAEKGRRKLQMPPVMEERKPIDAVLDKDPGIVGFDKVKYVCVDISHPVNDRDRIIVVREPDGTLREAVWEERDRLNQVFFPRPQRKTDTVPDMFEPDKLRDILAPDRYEYILDRNCLQFEPDHPIYIRTAESVYDHMTEKRNFDALTSTRHHGPFVFHLVWNKKCDGLIAHHLAKLDVSKAAAVVDVYSRVHEESGVNGLQREQCQTDRDLVELYIEKDSSKREKLSSALKAALETIEKSQNAEKSARKAHGTEH